MYLLKRDLYIKTLIEDIAEKTGNSAYMSMLIRTSSGGLSIDKSFSLEYLKQMKFDELSKILVPIDTALKNLPEIKISDGDFDRIVNGGLPFRPSVEDHSDLRAASALPHGGL